MKKLSFIPLLIFLLVNIQCGGGGDRTHSGTTPVSIKVTEITDGTGSGSNQLSGAVMTRDLASAVADGEEEGRQLSLCRITITGPGMADMVREVDIAGKSSIRETFMVPSGLNRSFLIQMFIENNDTVIVQAKSDGKNLKGTYQEILMEPTRQADYFEAPEFSGILSVSNAETRSVMLNWKPATDNITDQKRMQYLIYLTTQSKRDQNTNDIFKAYEMGKGTIREEDPLLKYYYVDGEQVISYEYEGAIPEDENTLSGLVSHRLKTGVPYLFMVRASDEWGFAEDNMVESEQIVVYMLDVTIVGSGRVITKPEGIDCGEKCSEDFLSKKEVTLTAIAEEGAAFNGWEGGGCIGADDCKLTLKNNESIIANFCESKTYYKDEDGDTYGAPNKAMQSCSEPDGYVINSADCDDTNADNNPGAAEQCDEIDNNCNGQVDEGVVTNTYYRDADNDGFGDSNNTAQACLQPSGHVTDNTDCDDTDAAMNPGAAEQCDEIDNNCNGQVDEDVTISTYYRDADSDTYGDPDMSMQSCLMPSGYVIDNTDCDDTKASINPGAAEECDEIDNNCDSQIDEGVFGTYYEDTDADGYGNPDANLQACSVCTALGCPTLDNTDCDDTNGAINPGAAEVCDEIDNNCSGQVDEGIDKTTYYRDADSDGYGDPNNSIQACSQPSEYITDKTDCDDSKSSVNPDENEVCDGEDNNCDGSTDENFKLGVDCTVGNGECEANGTTICKSDGSGTTCNATAGKPSTEECDGLDNDCDGDVDDNIAKESTTCGTGECKSSGMKQCIDGELIDSCKPDDPSDEICDDRDNDCDGSTDENFKLGVGCTVGKGECEASGTTICKSDGSGTTCNATAGKPSTEECDGLDNDCDGVLDGSENLTQSCGKTNTGECTLGTEYCNDSGKWDDCNAILPVDEIPGTPTCSDKKDNDCDGNIDEGCGPKRGDFCGLDDNGGNLVFDCNLKCFPAYFEGDERCHDGTSYPDYADFMCPELNYDDGDCLLPAPDQTYPPDGVVYDHYPRTTTLIWDAVSGAVSYTVEVDCFHCCQASQWCTDVGGMYKLEPNLKGTSFKFDFVGAQPGRWRVWAVDSNGRAGAKSQWRTFRYTQ